MTTLYLAQDPAADKFLAKDPLALLVGMLLDQQIPLERAFSAPLELAERLSVKKLVAADLAAYDADELAAIYSQRPALHRFPGAMAARSQKLAQLIVDEYDGDAAAVWRTAESGSQLLKRIAALPGFGKQKAKIFVGLLGKQLGVRPTGWREAAGEFGEVDSFRSVADIVDAESLARVREYKKAMKAAAKAHG